jgi:hypothetical protein
MILLKSILKAIGFLILVIIIGTIIGIFYAGFLLLVSIFISDILICKLIFLGILLIGIFTYLVIQNYKDEKNSKK